MAYNKSKYVEAAQKLLNQGKVAQAIAEYQQILKYEPKDQVTLMTIGELYIRQGETFQAIDYFERLAQIFVGDGFLTKAIAVYKRIAKLAPEEIRPLEKLADLYVQQGVMSEARPLFLQLAEIHLKNNRQPEAVGLLKKLLLAEPDNLRIQIRLADLYQAMGQSREAVDTYVSAAQRALARGDQAESDKLADKALKIDANCLAATIVKARSFSSQGKLTQAAELLEHAPDLDKGGEQTELLLDLYFKSANWDKATALALRVVGADSKNFGPAQKIVEALLEAGQSDRATAIIGQIRVPMIDAGEHEVIGRMQNELASRMPGRIEPLEWLVDFYGRTSDSFRLPDALSQLGDALAAANQLDRAKTIFEQLLDRQPDSDSARRKLDAILRKMGLLPAEPIPAPPLDEETQKFIAQSLTDVDLFASYGLTQKAIGLLEAILRRAPRHTPTLEKLLDFVLGAGDDRRTAELAAQLEQIHSETGDQRSSERFGELRRRFQRAAGLTDAELAIAVPRAQPAAPQASEPESPQGSIPEIAAEPAPEEPAPAPVAAQPPPAEKARPEPVEVNAAPAQAEVQEVDLSDEWATLLEETRPTEAPVAPPAKAPAKPAAAPTRPSKPGGVEEFEIGEEPLIAPPADAPGVAAFDSAPGTPLQPEPITEKTKAKPAAAKPAQQPSAKAPQKPAQPSEAEFELEQEYELVLDAEPLVPAYDQRPPDKPVAPPAPAAQNNASKPPSGSGFASDQFLADLANEIDQLGIDQLTPAFSGSTPNAQPEPPSKPAATPANSAESGPLKEVFDEFRAELGEMGAEDEDLETHYNLGIAFREMGLLEEAISEFQKVAKASDRGRAFRYTMQ